MGPLFVFFLCLSSETKTAAADERLTGGWRFSSLGRLGVRFGLGWDNQLHTGYRMPVGIRRNGWLVKREQRNGFGAGRKEFGMSFPPGSVCFLCECLCCR